MAIKYMSELFQSSIKLVDILKMNTKEDLKKMAKILSLSIPTKLRKEEYATCFADAVLACPDMWLPHLTQYELILLEKLVKAGPDTYVEGPDTTIFLTIEMLSFVVTDWDHLKEGTMRYMMCDELREAIAPHISNCLTSEKQKTRFVVEQYAYGFANLYGLIPYWELKDLLSEYLPDSMTKQEISEHLSNSLWIQRHIMNAPKKYHSILYIRSPFLDDVERFNNKFFENRAIPGRKRYTREEVFLMGSMPLFQIPNIYREKLVKYMINKMGLSEDRAKSDLQYLWDAIQLREDTLFIITSMIGDKLSSKKDLKEATELYTCYLNNSPRWCMMGFSIREASEFFKKNKNRLPHVVNGPNMQIVGKSMTQGIENGFNDILEDVFSDQKIGRNDPCPCGSGKKYKKCCGKDK